MRRSLCVLYWLLPIVVQANHIIGGELTMRSLGKPGYFRVQLDQYLNKLNLSNQNANTSVRVSIYQRREPALIESLTLPLVVNTPIPYTSPACAQTQPLQTVQATFYKDIQFDPAKYTDTQGYYMVWGTCCRDNNTNLVNASADGMTLYLAFPAMQRDGIPFVNSSPVFGQPTGENICLNKLTTLTAMATDADGDQLRYSLVTPFQSYTGSSPISDYPLVRWVAGITGDKPIPGSPPLQIDATSGQLSLRATQVGYYLFTVQCDEFRQGERIGYSRRDFMLPVVDCQLTAPPTPVIRSGNTPTADVGLCPGTSATLTVDADPRWLHQWQLNGIAIAGATSATFVTNRGGTYSVLRTSDDKCVRDVASQPVHLRQFPPITVTADSVSPICANQAPIRLTGRPTSGQWTGPGTRSDEFYPEQAGVGHHALAYTVTDPNGCTTTVKRWAQVTPPLTLTGPLLYRLQPGSTARLLQQPSLSRAKLNWLPTLYLDDPTSAAPLCTPVDSQTYTVKAEEGNCTASATVMVWVDRLYVPSAFSPNGDGQNDVWQIINTEAYPECEVQVFNRWGKLVYRASGSTEKPWDGTHEQHPLESGVYTYRITPAPTLPVRYGSVTIIR